MTTRIDFAAALLLVSAVTMAQPAGLRIVVVEGEDAVNIVQQKTAVAPVVEVRDRNNVPVPGALVTFTIQGGKAATFGGVSTLTVATNAARSPVRSRSKFDPRPSASRRSLITSSPATFR